MKIHKLLIMTMLITTVFGASTAFAQDDAAECAVAYLFNAWARSSVEGAPTGAVFGLLVNLSDEQDTLIGASTDAAEAVELHETIMGENDVMQMRPVEGGFDIPADRYVELQPGGLHIMLINLTQPLAAGETLDLTLNFEKAGDVPLSVPIRDMDDKAQTMAQSPISWDAPCAKLQIVDAWIRPAGAGMPTSAAYGLLLNLTDSDKWVVGGSTDVAEAVELHEMVMGENDVMQMRPVEEGFYVPAGGATLLKPGGLHLMLINLTQELQVGDRVDISLVLTDDSTMELSVPVREAVENEMKENGM